MTRYFFLVALLVVAMVAPASAGLDHIPNGLVVGTYPAEDSAGVTPGDNDLYVVGTLEVDGAAKFDGAVTMTSTVGITGALSLTAGLTVGTDLTVGDEIYMYEAGGTILSNKIDVDANEAFVLYGPTNPVSLANKAMLTVSTSTVTVNSTVLDVSDVELATISSRAGDLSMTVSDTSGNVAFNGVIDVSDIEQATASARDGALALTFTDSTGVVVFAATPTGGSLDFSGTGAFDTLNADTIEDEAGSGAPAFTYGLSSGANIVSDATGTDQLGTYTVTWSAVVADEGNFDTIGDATDGTDAMTISNGGVVDFTQTCTGGSLNFSGTLECDALDADEISDEAGTGAPKLVYGCTTGGNIVTDTDGNDEVGTFAATFAAMCATEIDCSTIGDSVDGTDAIAIANDGVCTFQQKMVLGTSAKVLRRVWIPATDFKLPTSAPGTASETASIGTVTFDQDSAVDYAWFSWVVPQDCDTASDAEMHVVYTPSTDATAPAAGNWSSEINAMADGSTVAAAAVALEDITDTPQGIQGDGTMAKWNVTAGATIPNANLAVDTVINVQLYHDYAVAAFGNDPLVAGVWIEYVADKLGE